MRVLCQRQGGLAIDHPTDRNIPGQTLSYGVNYVADELAVPWFEYHSDPAHPFPLVADGTISQLPDEDTPEPEPAPSPKAKAAPDPAPEPVPESEKDA